MTRSECIETLKHISPYLKENYGIRSLSLFGSVAKDRHTDESDIDLFIDMPPKALRLVELGYFLENLFGRSVDLIRASKHLNSVFLNEIKKDGIRIF